MLHTDAARLVAAGAVFFMVSDATLAFNPFVSPVPFAIPWVLGTYCAAQCLIVMGMLRPEVAPTPR